MYTERVVQSVHFIVCTFAYLCFKLYTCSDIEALLQDVKENEALSNSDFPKPRKYFGDLLKPRYIKEVSG